MTLVCEWYSGTYLTWHIQYLFFEGKWQKLRLVIDRPSFSGKITVTGGILGSNCSLCFLHQFQADLTLAHHKQIWKLRNQTLPISTPKISWFRVVTVGRKSASHGQVWTQRYCRESGGAQWPAALGRGAMAAIRVMLMTGCEQPRITTQKIWFY